MFMSTHTLEVAEELDATVVNMRFVKPMDETMILDMSASHDLLVTIEENVIEGGAGSAVGEVLANHDISHPLIQYGLPDRLIPHGSREDMLNDAGLNKAGFLEFIQTHLHKNNTGNQKIKSA